MSDEKTAIMCFMCNWVFCNKKDSLISQQEPFSFTANIIRVMCIGRINPDLVLTAFEKGFGGVLLIGCTPPDCHFVTGNLYAEQNVKLLKKLMALSNLNPGRLDIRWWSPVDDLQLSQILTDFALKIQEIGPSPLANQLSNEEISLNVLAAKKAAADFRLRVLAGREKELTENKNVYGKTISYEEYDDLLTVIASEEFIRHKIHILIQQTPLSVKEIAEKIFKEPSFVLRHIVEMRRKGMITLDTVEGRTPLYKALEDS